MRRPLFGNGIPVPVDLAALEVFDTKDFDPPNEQHSYALTLFYWDTPTDAAQGFTVQVKTDGVPTIYLNVSAANMAAKRLSPNGAFLMIDRLVLRGNQQVEVGILTGGKGHVFGYFERDGVADISLNYRPFQPGPLAAPYNATPAVLLVGPSVGQETDIHALDPDYIDIIRMDISSNINVGVAGVPPGVAAVQLPGGIVLPYLSVPNNQIIVDTLFPGIPMRAPTSASVFGFFNRG
jgi:hypothetical protein